MKLVIPPECKVGPYTFRIRWNDEYLDAAGIRAHESVRKELIRLHTGQSPTAVFDTLLHEAEHIANYLYGLKGTQERDLDARGTALTQFLISLGIEPDFSEIPKEVSE